MLAKACVVIAMHSCGSSAPTAWMRLKSGASRSTQRSARSARTMRASVAPGRGGGDGYITSQVIGTRIASSSAIRLWSSVVPVRGSPRMNTGRRMRCVFDLRIGAAITLHLQPVDEQVDEIVRTAMRPVSVSCASSSVARVSRSSGSAIGSGP